MVWGGSSVAAIERRGPGHYLRSAIISASNVPLQAIRTFLPTRRPAPCRVPSGRRIYAVGDIHGRLDLLDQILRQIEEDCAARQAAETLIIFLGDLVDRGPDSCGVVARLLDFSRGPTPSRFLMGNHEEVFLRALTGDLKALRFLIRIGGRETIISYGVHPDEYSKLDYEPLARLLADRVPKQHADFLASFERWIEIGDYLFVHAGLRPGLPIEEQSSNDLRWIRDEFLQHRGPFGKIIVHGHSISEEVELRPNRIGIDTGAFATGRLTAIGLEEDRRWFLST